MVGVLYGQLVPGPQAPEMLGMGFSESPGGFGVRSHLTHEKGKDYCDDGVLPLSNAKDFLLYGTWDGVGGDTDLRVGPYAYRVKGVQGGWPHGGVHREHADYFMSRQHNTGQGTNNHNKVGRNRNGYVVRVDRKGKVKWSMSTTEGFCWNNVVAEENGKVYVLLQSMFRYVQNSTPSYVINRLHTRINIWDSEGEEVQVLELHDDGIQTNGLNMGNHLYRFHMLVLDAESGMVLDHFEPFKLKKGFKFHRFNQALRMTVNNNQMVLLVRFYDLGTKLTKPIDLGGYSTWFDGATGWTNLLRYDVSNNFNDKNLKGAIWYKSTPEVVDMVADDGHVYLLLGATGREELFKFGNKKKWAFKLGSKYGAGPVLLGLKANFDIDNSSNPVVWGHELPTKGSYEGLHLAMDGGRVYATGRYGYDSWKDITWGNYTFPELVKYKYPKSSGINAPESNYYSKWKNACWVSVNAANGEKLSAGVAMGNDVRPVGLAVKNGFVFFNVAFTGSGYNNTAVDGDDGRNRLWFPISPSGQGAALEVSEHQPQSPLYALAVYDGANGQVKFAQRELSNNVEKEASGSAAISSSARVYMGIGASGPIPKETQESDQLTKVWDAFFPQKGMNHTSPDDPNGYYGKLADMACTFDLATYTLKYDCDAAYAPRVTNQLGDAVPNGGKLALGDVLAITLPSRPGYTVKMGETKGLELLTSGKYRVVGALLSESGDPEKYGAFFKVVYEPKPLAWLDKGFTNGTIEVLHSVGGSPTKLAANVKQLKGGEEFWIVQHPNDGYLEASKSEMGDFLVGSPEHASYNEATGRYTVAGTGDIPLGYTFKVRECHFSLNPVVEPSFTLGDAGAPELKRNRSGATGLVQAGIDKLQVGDVLIVNPTCKPGWKAKVSVTGATKKNTTSDREWNVSGLEESMVVTIEYTRKPLSLDFNDKLVGVTVDGMPKSKGDVVHVGDVLEVMPKTVAPGYEVVVKSVSPATSTGANSWKIGDPGTATTVMVNAEKQKKGLTLRISPAVNASEGSIKVTVERNSAVLSLVDGDAVFVGEELKVVATSGTGYVLKFKVLGANGSGASWTVDASNTANPDEVHVQVTVSKRDYPLDLSGVKHGSFTVKRKVSGGGFETLADGSKLQVGDELVLSGSPESGYDAVVPGDVTKSGVKGNWPNYTVDGSADNVGFTYTFPLKSLKYEVVFNDKEGSAGVDESGTLHPKGLTELGAVLAVKASPKTGYEVASISATGVEDPTVYNKQSEASFTVSGAADPIVISVEFARIARTLTIGKDWITVKRKGVELPDGAKVYVGDVLELVVATEPGKERKPSVTGATEQTPLKWLLTGKGDVTVDGTEETEKYSLSMDVSGGEIIVTGLPGGPHSSTTTTVADIPYGTIFTIEQVLAPGVNKLVDPVFPGTSYDKASKQYTVIGDVTISVDYSIQKFTFELSPAADILATETSPGSDPISTTKKYSYGTKFTLAPTDDAKTAHPGEKAVFEVIGASYDASAREYTVDGSGSTDGKVKVTMRWEAELYSLSRSVEHGDLIVNLDGTQKDDGLEVFERGDIFTLEQLPKPKQQYRPLTIDELKTAVKGATCETGASGITCTVTGNVAIDISYPEKGYPVSGVDIATDGKKSCTVMVGGNNLIQNEELHFGDKIAVDVEAEPGYRPVVEITGAAKPSSGNEWTVDGSAEQISVKVSFEKVDIPVILQVSGPTWGAISFLKEDGTPLHTGSQVQVGDKFTLEVTPKTGYEAKFSVKGADEDATATGGYVVNSSNPNISGKYTLVVVVTFSEKDVKIVSVPDASIAKVTTPDGTGTKDVDAGDVVHVGQELTVTPVLKPGEKATITITAEDGTETDIPAGGKYVVKGDEGGISIVVDITNADIILVVENVTPLQGAYTMTRQRGAASPGPIANGDAVQLGDVITLTLSPEAGYEVDELLANGWLEKLPTAPNKLTVISTTGTEPTPKITVSFKPEDLTLKVPTVDNATVVVTIPDGSSGTKNLAEDQEAPVHKGDRISITVTPEKGWKLKDGYPKVKNASPDGHDFIIGTQPPVLDVLLEKIPVAFTATSTRGGTLTITKGGADFIKLDGEAEEAKTVVIGDELSISFVPKTGWEVDGHLSVGTMTSTTSPASYTIGETDLNGLTKASIAFKKQVYTLTTGDYATVTVELEGASSTIVAMPGTSNTKVSVGDALLVEVAPAAGKVRTIKEVKGATLNMADGKYYVDGDQPVKVIVEERDMEIEMVVGRPDTKEGILVVNGKTMTLADLKDKDGGAIASLDNLPDEVKGLKIGNTFEVIATHAAGYTNPTITVTGAKKTAPGIYEVDGSAETVGISVIFEPLSLDFHIVEDGPSGESIARNEDKSGAEIADGSTVSVGQVVFIDTVPPFGYIVKEITVTNAEPTVNTAKCQEWTVGTDNQPVMATVTYGPRKYPVEYILKNGSVALQPAPVGTPPMVPFDSEFTIEQTPDAGYSELPVDKLFVKGAAYNATDKKYKVNGHMPDGSIVERVIIIADFPQTQYDVVVEPGDQNKGTTSVTVGGAPLSTGDKLFAGQDIRVEAMPKTTPGGEHYV
ncbi:MAG: hypothetical protein CSA97_00935, partial [Bacteroidetes bacterium]